MNYMSYTLFLGNGGNKCEICDGNEKSTVLSYVQIGECLYPLLLSNSNQLNST